MCAGGEARMDHKITKCLWCIVLDLLKRWIPFVFMVIPISEIVISCFWLQENVAGMGGWEGWNTIQDYATLLTSTHQAASNIQWKYWILDFSNTIKVIKPPLIYHRIRRQYKFCKRCIIKNTKILWLSSICILAAKLEATHLIKINPAFNRPLEEELIQIM